MMILVTIMGQAFAITREERLLALGERMLEDSVAARFGAARMLVPAFGDWAYGWGQSYLTSYRIIGRALARIGDAAAQERIPDPEALVHDLAEPVRAAFRERVTVPSLGDGGFQRDMAHIARTLAERWPTCPGLEVRLAEVLGLDPAGRLAEASGAETIFLRSMRPMAARLGAVTLRVSEAGSVVAALGYLGWGAAGAPGVVAGVTGGIGLAWGVDWMINRVDAGLNRASFEARAQQAIGMAEASVLADGIAALRGTLRDAAARCL
ncbi:MAG: hypothetical protein JWR10_3474 [Rubritepida sp.]|nr:hypothetical protein [Rubritepida sp.]